MAKKTLVMAFGSFDVLHPGHLLYLRKAKSLGDRLVVVVARDRSIKMIKGRAPAMSEDARLEIVGALKHVDEAVMGNKLAKSSERYRIFKKYRPDVIVFGYDQRVDDELLQKELHSVGVNAKIVRLKTSMDPKSFKSSVIKKRLLD
jgi:FAD synthetase